MTEPELHDYEARALWHLALVPEDIEPPDPGFGQPREVGYGDEDDDDLACTHCGGEGYREVDDPLWDECDEFGYGECSSCNGTGLRSRQWVF